MNNKRNLNRFDPFVPVNMHNVGKTKLNTSRDIKIEGEVVTRNPVSFFTMDENFKCDMPRVKKGFVLLMTKKEIGVNNDLGSKLLQDFIFSVSELIELPEHVIIMNDAVYLLDNKNICDYILKMQKYGVKFLVSSESIKYFNYINSLRGIKQATSADITEKIIFSEKLINM